MGELSFESINFYGQSVGTLEINEGTFRWTSRNNSVSKDFKIEDVEKPFWAIFGKYGYLKLIMKDGNANRLDGFPPEDYKKLKHLFASHELKLNKERVASGGGNYADLEFEGNRLVFSNGEEHLMELDTSLISQCVLPGNKKDNTVELMFVEGDTANKDEERLTSIRLYIPPGTEDESGAQIFQQDIMRRTKISTVKGDVLVELEREQGTFLTPRGKYNVELYAKFMRMHGNKYDYKIQYKDMSKLFLLELPDRYRSAFIFSLTKPIRQGQQRYTNLVLQTTSEESDLKINLDEDACKEKYKGELEPEMSGPLCNLIARICKHICGKKVYVPGKFRSAQEDYCIKCALKANEGFLYPMEKNFVFIHKPTVITPFNEVEQVSFQRYSGSGASATKNFEIIISLRGEGGDEGKDLVFSGVDRSEYAPLYAFLSTKKLKVIAAAEPEKENALSAMLGEEGELDDDDSEEDDDFNPDAKGSESGGDESDAGSGDSDISYASEGFSDEEETPVKKKKEKKPKKEKKQKAVELDSPTPKKAKRKKKKDKNAPKKARNAFSFFMSSAREDLKKENPDATFAELGKLTGQRWKEIDPETKLEYEQMAARDKERYDREMKDYTPPSDDSDEDLDEAPTKGKKKRKKKDPNAPKGPLSAYIMFSQSERESIVKENPEMKATEIMRESGKRWAALDEASKKKWNEQAAEAKAAHKIAMKEYEANKKTEGDDDDDDDDDDEAERSPAPKKKKSKKLPAPTEDEDDDDMLSDSDDDSS